MGWRTSGPLSPLADPARPGPAARPDRARGLGRGRPRAARPTDALRAHWFALPLMARLAEVAAPVEGTVNIVLDEGAFHIQIGAAEPAYGHGLAEHPDAELTFDAVACAAVARGEATLPELIKTSQIHVDGDGPLARALRRQ